MPATLRDVVSDAQGIVGEVAGPGVQTYSEDRMFADAVRGFNMLFKKYNWRQYCDWKRIELDGVKGYPATNELAYVLDFEDIIIVRNDKSHVNLSLRLRNTNPFTNNLIGGNAAVCWDSINVADPDYNNKKIRVLPITATTALNVYAKFYPITFDGQWDWEDIMYMDRDMLAMATAFATLSGDELNPGGADSIRSMMEGRYKDIQGSLSSHEMSFGNSAGVGIPSSWTTL